MANFSFNGNNNGNIYSAENESTINIYENGYNFNSSLDKFKQELESFILLADKTNKLFLQEALEAINQKDEGKFKNALKKAGSFFNNVISKLTERIIFEYMKQNGLI